MSSRRCRRSHDRHSRARHVLRLEDLKGEWAFFSDSIGGVLGATGKSSTTDGQVTINADGTGIVNFGTGIQYSGVAGQLTTFDFSGSVVSYTITNPEKGIGIATIAAPFGEGINTSDFIALRKHGRVVRLEGHISSFFPTTDNITTYTLERQNQ